jgi:signal transduction histidine kinase
MNGMNLFVTESPYSAQDTARRARFLITLSGRAIQFSIALLVLLAVLLLRDFSLPLLAVTFLSLLYIPTSIVARRMAERGKPDTGGYVFLLLILLIVPANALLIDGFYPILVPGYLLAIATAGLILRPGESILVAVVSAILFIAAQVIDSAGIARAQLPEPVSTIAVTAIISMAFIFVAFINRTATDNLRRALDEATYDLFQANRKLSQASEMKSQFTARTSHELRTPLSSMIVFTDLALREAYGPINGKMRHALTHVLTSARHLRSIINDILDLSKIEAGQLEISEESFPLSNLVEAVDGGSGGLAQEKGLRWSVTTSPDMPPYLIGDEGRLAQILVNLAGNAVKFTEKGEVEVRLERTDGDRWQMVVRDTGPGIPEDQFEMVFQAYRQLDSTASGSKIKGTGLGLAITRHLVRMMDGDLSLESELGRGSTFTVKLPLRVGSPTQIEAEPVPAL